jgi:ABC transporter transmembrane region
MLASLVPCGACARRLARPLHRTRGALLSAPEGRTEANPLLSLLAERWVVARRGEPREDSRTAALAASLCPRLSLGGDIIDLAHSSLILPRRFGGGRWASRRLGRRGPIRGGVSRGFEVGTRWGRYHPGVSDTTTPPPLAGVLGGGLSLTWSFVKRRPFSFSLAVFGAIMFVSAIVASAVVVGRVTDSLIIPVLQDGESTAGKLWPAMGLIFGVAVWKSVGITLRRSAAGWLQFGTRADARKRLIDHQMRLDLAWHDRRSTGDLLSVSEVDTNQGTFVLAPFPYATGSTLLLIGTIVLSGV